MALSFISVTIPGIASKVQNSLLGFIYFDIFQSSLWMTTAFPDKLSNDVHARTTPLSDYFLINSYASLDLVDNLGSTFLFVLAFIFAHLTAPLLQLAAKRYSSLERARNCVDKNLYWNGTLRFIVQ